MKVPLANYKGFYISKENFDNIKNRETLNRYLEFFRTIISQMKTSLSQEDIRKYNRGIWKLLLGGIVFFAIFIVLIGFGVFGEIPSFRAIEHPKSNEATEILSEDGKVLGTYFVKNRSNVNYNQISPNVINALIATEDVRFPLAFRN
ncbi:MAG: transglycosylase domain-containing protein [Nocardioides sp.]